MIMKIGKEIEKEELNNIMWDYCIISFLILSIIVAIIKGWWRSALEILFQS